MAEVNKHGQRVQTGVDSLVLLDVGELLERLVAVGARVLAHVGVNERVLRQLLRRRERLETLAALVTLLFHTMRLLGVTLHVRLVGKLLPPTNTSPFQPDSYNQYRSTSHNPTFHT